MSEDNTIRVVAAIADKAIVTLYLESGESLIIKQGDHRLNDLLDAIIPITTRGEVAIISLEEFSVYSAFQRKSTGLIKLFKIAKKALLGSSDEPPAKTAISEETVNAINNALHPAPVAPLALTDPATQTQRETIQRIAEARAEQLRQSPEPVPEPQPEPVPVTQEERLKDHLKEIGADDHVAEEETVVAVIGGVVIPGIENIKPIIDRAVKNNSTVAVENFLKRLAPMIEKRAHSVEDILRFLEKGDLPLAEDGTIIAYKMLRYKYGDQDTFVDCHTQKVTQKVGSYVCVDESLVDTNRRNECSNGLHIARRGYLSGFSGDLCVLCKVPPEDVITVPHGDANKVRVKGYHILGILSAEAKAALEQNKPMTSDTPALKMVYEAIKGHHVGRLEEVRITGQMGSGVQITKLSGTKKEEAPEVVAEDLKIAAALDDDVVASVAVNPKDINKRVNDEIKQMQNPNQVSEELGSALENEDLEPVREQLDPVPLPEETKPDVDAKRLAKRERDRASKAKRRSEKLMEKAFPSSKAKTPAEQAKLDRKAKKAAKVKPINEAPKPVKSGTKTKQDEARELFEAGKFAELKAMKKRVKKGWDALGFTITEVEKITSN